MILTYDALIKLCFGHVMAFEAANICKSAQKIAIFSTGAVLYSLSVSFFQKIRFHEIMDSLQHRNIFCTKAGCLCNNINSNAEPLEIIGSF